MQLLAEKIGIPLGEWPGNCYAIACALVRCGAVEGRAVYGHYLGPVAPGTMFDGKPIIQHGWVETADGRIVDPTRWVFEDVAPYLFEADACAATDYDEGGNVFRGACLGQPPAHDPGGRVVPIEDPEAKVLVSGLLGREGIQEALCTAELHWLGNQLPHALGNRASALYAFLARVGERGWIPIDNWRKVMERAA